MIYIRLFSLIVIGLFGASSICAQDKHNIQGEVVDTLGNPLIGATSILLNAQDSILSGFSITNEAGEYVINNVSNGEYILQITYIGYQNFSQNLSVNSKDPSLIPQADIVLRVANKLMDVVEIKAEHIPIQINNDTIQYNSAAYKTKPNAAVEELLKRLPGVEVDKDGTVTAQGEEIKSVLVDGKEFFGDDPKMATKNLPADIIDQVQIFDRKSDMAEFSGVDDGNEVRTINLKLKEGKNKGYFGNILGGIGTDNRFQSKANINRFSKNTQVSFLGMYNNINARGFSYSDYSDFMGGMRGGGSGRNSDVPLNYQDGDGLTKTGATGINFNREFSKKIDFQSSYFLTSINADIRDSTFSQNLLANSSYNSLSNATTETKSLTHKVNARLQIELDSTQRLLWTTRASLSSANGATETELQNLNNAEILENLGIGNYQSDQDKYNINSRLTYRKRLNRKGRNLVAQTNYTRGQSDLLSNLLNDNTFFLVALPDSIQRINQRQVTDNSSNQYKLSLSYTEPLRNDFYLEMNAAQSNTNTDNAKDFYDILLVGNEDFNEELSSFYNRDYNEQTLGSNLRYAGEYLNASAGISYQNSRLKGFLFDEMIEIKNNWNYFLPSLRLNYDINESSSVRLNYGTRINEPSLTQLQPIQDNSDPLNIQIGNPTLVPEYVHSASLRYRMFDQFSFTSFFTTFRATLRKDNIIDSTSINQFLVRTRTPINADYAFNLSNGTYYSRPINSLKTNIRFSTSINYNRSQVYVSGLNQVVINDQDRLTYGAGLRLENKNKDHFDLSVGTQLTFNETKYSVSTRQNQSFTQQNYYSNLIIYFPKSIVFETNYSINQYSQESFGDNQQIASWNASIGKSFLSNERLTVSLNVFDLLDQNRGFNRISNAELIQETSTNSLERYFMLTATYKLSSFGGYSGNRRGSGPPSRGRY